MGKFVYVYQSAARDKLAQAGFVMVKADERNHIWVFARDSVPGYCLDDAEVSYILSDTLTF
jgi:hypothetical protein